MGRPPEHGIEKLNAHKPDVIILDLSLPDSQGLETFTRVYAQAPDVPVVVLTGMTDEEIAVQAVRRQRAGLPGEE